MEGVQHFSTGRIKLDVGGVLFNATRETLCRVAGSMLEAMFSGRHKVNLQDDNTYFIDRDGTHFRYILNYLRTGAVSAPNDSTAKLELAAESDFYGLHALVLERKPRSSGAALRKQTTSLSCGR